MAGLLGHWTVQTALVLAAPALVPKVISYAQRFLNPQPVGQRTKLAGGAVPTLPPPRDDPRYAALRLFVLTLGVSVALFTALSPPHNLFLSLSTPRSFLEIPFPLLRTPLDLRLATETLAKAWQTHLGRTLTEDELSLAQRLQTLDARLAYIAYGAGPLMNCSWCKPPGTTTAAGLLGTDYLLAIAPGVAIAYLTALSAAGVLLAGNGRQRWRKWAVAAVVVGGLVEVYLRLTWSGARGGIGGSVTLIHSQLHLLRSLGFAALIILSYLVPPSRQPVPPSTAALVGPTVAAIAAQSENVLHRLRALSVQRMAILHDDESREKVISFWASASAESTLARSSPAIQNLLETQVAPAAEPFRAWLEVAMAPLGPARGALVEQKDGEETGEETEEGKTTEEEEPAGAAEKGKEPPLTA
ncbi:hypothetical protein JCM8547_000202 [Rhodosporidiobolus lusitaniae]